MTKPKEKESVVSVYYQKVMVLIMTILIGYIATVAGGVKTDIEVLKNNSEHMVKTINTLEATTTQHTKDLHAQDTRLVRVEAKINTGG